MHPNIHCNCILYAYISLFSLFISKTTCLNAFSKASKSVTDIKIQFVGFKGYCWRGIPKQLIDIYEKHRVQNIKTENRFRRQDKHLIHPLI